MNNPTTRLHGATCRTTGESDVFAIRTEKRGDTTVISEVYTGDCYRLAELARGGLEPATILDIGAHIGTFTVLARRLWPDARVWCLEPNPRSFELLSENTKRFPDGSDGQPTVEPINAAIGYARGTVLTDGHTATGGGFMTTEERYEKQANKSQYTVCARDVRVFSFEWLLDLVEEVTGRRHVDLVKFDCEGGEVDTLTNMQPESAAAIGRVVGEYHHPKGAAGFRALAESRFPGRTIEIIDRGNIGPFWIY